MVSGARTTTTANNKTFISDKTLSQLQSTHPLPPCSRSGYDNIGPESKQNNGLLESTGPGRAVERPAHD